MAAKKQTAIDFTRALLKKKPTVEFKEVAAAGKKKGLVIYPIVYGRAKALEGLVKVAPYGSKKKTKSGRGPGRPKGSKNKRPARPTHTVATAMDSLETVIAAMRRSNEERERYQRALQKIKDILGQVLEAEAGA
jgi:ABC-type branched-subunit amino acid transport system substrate-binding protein